MSETSFILSLTSAPLPGIIAAVSTAAAVGRALGPTAGTLGLDLKVADAARPPKIIAMVSAFDHALLRLLYQIRVGWLRAEVVAIVSNHADARRIADHEGIRFVDLPVGHYVTADLDEGQIIEQDVARASATPTPATTSSPSVATPSRASSPAP